MANKMDVIRELVKELNFYRDEYYNHNRSVVTDREYDDKFDTLKRFEQETGCILSTSPTQTVGYQVVSQLNKVKHNHPMLSLDKTKSSSDLVKFANNHDTIVMAKMDGLTCSLRYVNGQLVSAETRGNGDIGEDVLHCARVIKNIPVKINVPSEVIVDGEVIITYDDFDLINECLDPESKYKNPRNLAAGSIRQLDSKLAAARNMKFIAWKLVKGCNDVLFHHRLEFLSMIGFEIVPYLPVPKQLSSASRYEFVIDSIKTQCYSKKYPIDGCVISYNDINYGESLGSTGHHARNQLAYKFYDDTYESVLRDVEWTMGKTNVLTPTAVFDSVKIDGTDITRASLHNISIMKELNARIGCSIKVYKANQIIPQIDCCEDDGISDIIIPDKCPICGCATKITKDNNSEILECTNPTCSGSMLGKFSCMVSRNALNIDGMSEATLSFLMNNGWVRTYADVYHLKKYKDEWSLTPGFGVRSVDKILKSIEKSRVVSLSNFITALSIPNVGSTTSKVLANTFKTFENWYSSAVVNRFDYTSINGFGVITSDSINEYCSSNKDIIYDLSKELTIQTDEIEMTTNNSLDGCSFCITGSLNTISRAELEKLITKNGGKHVNSVTKNTSYLITNDTEPSSSKYIAAIKYGTKIITEEEFFNKIKEF